MIARSLDLFSTSQTNECFSSEFTCAQPSVLCSYHAPFFAYQKEGKVYGVIQGCCNHWDCPRCGVQRAKMEYGRIVNGVVLLAKSHRVCFVTVTCKGKVLSVGEAEARYLEWTNTFLTNCRAKAKRTNQDWYYVQVTEKQKRGHPHSHILTTFIPDDLYLGHIEGWDNFEGRRVYYRDLALRSDWLQRAVISAGLGEQYDVSIVQTAAAASRYVAKYMFKDSMFGTHWPKGWKRVRYSQNFPKLPEKDTNAFVLLSKTDWSKLASLAAVVVTDSEFTKQEALTCLAGHDVLVG